MAKWEVVQRARPPWAKHCRKRSAIHSLARRLRGYGIDVEVDHIVPLQSRYVCGLDVWWNLRIVPRKENRQKAHLQWPGHPCETVDALPLFEPHQLSLPL